jgi:N-acetylglucosamine-6-phosphate deacetylase
MNIVCTYHGRDATSRELIEVDVADGHIAAIRRSTQADNNLWLAPGLIDLQVNGYDGIDLNDATCDMAAVVRVTEKLAALGTTTFLPTIVTANQKAMAARLRTIADARRQTPAMKHAVPCVHVEGPSISPLDGYRGAHPLSDVRPPSLAEFDELQKAADGLIGLVTISPHWPDASKYIRALCDNGIVVALGHTHASSDMIRSAVDAGAQLSTHLGNGIAAQLPRHPNPLWTQLAEDRLTATLIADGVHLPYDVLRVMLRAKGVERSVLVSDSVSLAGSTPGRYHSPIGGEVAVGRDGSIRMCNNDLLAGSGIALKDAVARVAGLQGYTLSDAVRMATTNPGRLLKNTEREITIGAPADLLQFRWASGENTLQLTESLVLGRSAMLNDEEKRGSSFMA